MKKIGDYKTMRPQIAVRKKVTEEQCNFAMKRFLCAMQMAEDEFGRLTNEANPFNRLYIHDVRDAFNKYRKSINRIIGREGIDLICEQADDLDSLEEDDFIAALAEVSNIEREYPAAAARVLLMENYLSLAAAEFIKATARTPKMVANVWEALNRYYGDKVITRSDGTNREQADRIVRISERLRLLK